VGVKTLPSPAPPSCTIYPKECSSFSKSYTTALSSYLASGGPEPSSPACIADPECKARPDCRLGFDISVYYWPENVQSTGVCDAAASTVTATPTGSGPNTAVVEGVTMTSPSVYLIGNDITASYKAEFPFNTRLCGTRTGGLVISLPASRLTTYKPFPTESMGDPSTTWYNPSSVKLKDFNWPVSSSVNCSTQTAILASGSTVAGAPAKCTTDVFDPFKFKPALAIPTEMRNKLLEIIPDYSDCTLGELSAAEWRPITTLPGDPRYTPGWNSISFPTFTGKVVRVERARKTDESSPQATAGSHVVPPYGAPTAAGSV